jgi:hypothetical protein
MAGARTSGMLMRSSVRHTNAHIVRCCRGDAASSPWGARIWSDLDGVAPVVLAICSQSSSQPSVECMHSKGVADSVVVHRMIPFFSFRFVCNPSPELTGLAIPQQQLPCVSILLLGIGLAWLRASEGGRDFAIAVAYVGVEDVSVGVRGRSSNRLRGEEDGWMDGWDVI